MANTKDKSAAMELLKYLKQRHDQSIEDAVASIDRAQTHLDNMGWGATLTIWGRALTI